MLRAVLDIVSDRGYQATRFQDVAASTGLAVSTLQGYFGSRADMVVEAMMTGTDDEVSAMQKAARESADPWQQLVILVDRGLRTPIPIWRVLMEFWCAAAHDEELRQHSITLQRKYRQPFLDAITGGIECGRFQPTHAPDAIADATIATLDGLLFPYVLRQPHPGDSVEVRAVILDQLAHTLGARS